MRPKGLTAATLAMCLLNPTGYLFLTGEGEARAGLAVLFTIFILVGYVVLWYFWNGRNWARILVLLASGLALVNLLGVPTASPIQAAVILVEAAVGAYLLYWLNRQDIRRYFRQNPVDRERGSGGN